MRALAVLLALVVGSGAAFAEVPEAVPGAVPEATADGSGDGDGTGTGKGKGKGNGNGEGKGNGDGHRLAGNPTVAPLRPVGPFVSSRLFAMPVADVVGAYQLSLSGDGSLLQETGLLSTAGVFAIGFGDIAQLEYRHTGAISIEGTTAPVPAIGVQLKAPLAERRYVPAFAVAFRLGVPRAETFGATTIDETVTDLYAVARLRLWGVLSPVTVHGGLRLSSASLTMGGDRSAEVERRLLLPAGGIELTMNPQARLIAEVGLVPQFTVDLAAATAPRIERGVLGRLGVRWYVHRLVSIDGSLGYQLEVAGSRAADGVGAVVQWDIRLGGEVVVPWGAIACHAAGIFCE